MKKVVLIALLALFASATSMPTLGKVLGFGTAAYAHGQGQNNNNTGNQGAQGEDESPLFQDGQ